MHARAHALDVIERALDVHPYCPACAAPTTIADDDGELVLRCSATIEPRGIIARFHAAMRPHIRRSVLDIRDVLAA